MGVVDDVQSHLFTSVFTGDFVPHGFYLPFFVVFIVFLGSILFQGNRITGVSALSFRDDLGKTCSMPSVSALLLSKIQNVPKEFCPCKLFAKLFGGWSLPPTESKN